MSPLPIQDNQYQTPRQALLSSIATFDKDVLSSPASADPGTFTTPLRTLLAGVVPPRDLQRSPAVNMGVSRIHRDGLGESLVLQSDGRSGVDEEVSWNGWRKSASIDPPTPSR